MIAVIIETSTERSIAALFKNEALLGQVELPCGLSSSRHLLSAVQSLLIENQLSASDLQLVISGVGPGSYTGIRVGAAIAKTLSFACRVPLVGVCSLEGFQPEKDASFAAVLDAKISGVYARFGVKREGRVIWEGEAEALPLEEAARRLSRVDFAISPCKLTQKLPDVSWDERYPDPFAIYRAGLKKYKAGEFTLDGSLKLCYLRKTQAEMELISFSS